MAKEKDEISLVSAVKVADRVSLQSVKLLACDCKQKPKCPDGQKAFDMEGTSRFEVNKEQNIIGVYIQFVLNAFGKEEVERKKENSFLNIEATFLLLYSISSVEDLDDTAFRSFAEVNGTYNAWPYWREFVQSITSRMELPTLTVPVFRISSVPSKTAANKDEPPVKVEL
jgi:preprotein translocase subunit SecB